MKNYTQKQLKALVNQGKAHDLTGYDFNRMNTFIKTHSFNRVGISRGIYGINGGLIQDTETGELYAVTARNSALFMIF